MHLPLESLADNSCFHCTKILFHAMENKVSYQKDTHFPPNIVCLSENHYKNRQIICLIRNFANFCMIYRDSSHLHFAYHYILLK